MICYYNVNNIVKFSLSGPKRFTNSFRYINYKVEYIEKKDLDFIINITKIDPNINSDVLDDKYLINENYFYCKNDNYKLFNWEIEYINKSSSPMIININVKNKILKYFKTIYIILEGIIIDPLIHLILIKKGCCLIHASCVSMNDKGTLLVGRSGSGKTTLSTKLNNNGFSFISDNFSILSSHDKATGFVEPINLFYYNLNEDIVKKLSIIQRLDILFKHLIYTISGHYLKFFIRINPFSILVNTKSFTKINNIFILIPKTDINAITLKKISKETLTMYLMYNQILEFPYFDKYLSNYSYMNSLTVLNHWEIYRNLLDKLIKDPSIYLLEYNHLDEDVLTMIMERMKNDE